MFTDPTQSQQLIVDTTNWSKSYNQVSEIIEPANTNLSTPGGLQTIKSILVTNEHESYLAWLLCALSLWVEVENPQKQRPGAKPKPPMAAVVAREGLKVENKNTSVIKDAVLHYPDIIAWKAAVPKSSPSISVPMKRKQTSLSREKFGMSIRRWGPHWRSIAMFALLTEVMETNEEHGQFCSPNALLKRFHTDM